jgi:NAD(P)H dehydrogenase (quinone)
MDNPLAAIPVVDGSLYWFMGNQPVGWIAPEDVAAVAANVLSEGPEQYGGKEYWLFTEMLNGTQAAVEISKGLGRPVEGVTLAPDHMAANGKSGAMKLSSFVEPTYGASILDWVRQSYD